MQSFSIIIKDVSVKFQSTNVLNIISFALHLTENLAIVGNSGSGKTMLAKALSDKTFHTGTIKFYTSDKISFKPKTYFVEQHYHFKNKSNVSEFYYQQRYNSFDAAETLCINDELKLIFDNDQAINFWLEKLNITHRKFSPLLQLSSGEHKRFQLAKAFLSKPQLLILDNPFVGVDIDTRKLIQQILSEVSDAIKLIVITHENEIPECITNVLELENGSVKFFGKKENNQHSNHNHQHSISNISFPFSSINILFSYAVKIIDATVQYGEKIILKNINWQIKNGERWLLKGSNGAGKSTLLSLITGDNPKAYSNEIYLFDKRRGSGESIWDIKKNIGYVSPELEWYFEKNISCYDVVGSGFFDTIGLFRSLSIEQKNMVEDWLNVLQLSSIKNKLFSNVSAGLQRMVLLARALIKNAPLLILDEPCQGLDDEQTKFFVELIDKLCTQLDKTLIYVSHYENEVPLCVTKTFYLDEINNSERKNKIINHAAIAV